MDYAKVRYGSYYKGGELICIFFWKLRVFATRQSSFSATCRTLETWNQSSILYNASMACKFAERHGNYKNSARLSSQRPFLPCIWSIPLKNFPRRIARFLLSTCWQGCRPFWSIERLASKDGTVTGKLGGLCLQGQSRTTFRLCLCSLRLSAAFRWASGKIGTFWRKFHACGRSWSVFCALGASAGSKASFAWCENCHIPNRSIADGLGSSNCWGFWYR